MARIDSFLRLVVEQRASDLHFCAGAIPSIRHDGELVQLPFRAMSGKETRRFLMEILDAEQRERILHRHDLDFVYTIDGIGRFRANIFTQARGLGAVFRIIPEEIPSLNKLALPETVRRLANMSNGLVLVTGPTGSGKSTTLAAMVDEVNATRRKHIITVEDPVEFIHKPKMSVITQRQIGVHIDTFANALRSALREAPDMVVVGEMRDMDTISLALTAAETGVLVLGTLHTNSAPAAIDRIVDATPDESRSQVRALLSVLLRGVISQHLIKRASGEGRIAAIEILTQTFAVSHMIREDKTFQLDALLQSSDAEQQGMQSLDTHLIRLVKSGMITPDSAMRIAKDPTGFRDMIVELGRAKR